MNAWYRLALGLCLTCLAGLFGAPALALEPIVIDAALDGLSLVGHAEFQRDPTNRELPTQLDPAAWRPLTLADRFQGISADSYWLRLELRNPGDATRHWVIAHEVAWTERMTVFADGVGARGESLGAQLAFSARALPSTLPAVIHGIGPGATLPVFIHLHNPSGTDMRLLLQLYEARNFVAAMQSYGNAQSLYLGVCVALAVIWGVFGAVLRQSTFVSYALYVLAAGIYWASARGLWFQYVVPEFPDWGNRFVLLSMCGATFFAFLFSRQALRLRAAAPTLDRVALGLLWFSGCVLLAIAFNLLPQGLANLLARGLGASMVLNAVFAWWSWRRGTPHTGWMVAGWGVFGLALFVTLPFATAGTSLSLFESVSAQGLNQIATLVEMLCFMLSLAQWVRTQRQERLAAEHSANTDGLTGLNNRKCVERRLDELLAQPATSGSRWLGVVDIDFFKKVNDSHGHAAGDAVLRDFAEVMRREMRQSDIYGRFGGEEFVLLLDGVDRVGAEATTNRLREAFEASPTAFEGKTIPHTLSLGLAAHAGETKLQPWFERADAALYEAKQGGRNRVCVAGTATAAAA